MKHGKLAAAVVFGLLGTGWLLSRGAAERASAAVQARLSTSWRFFRWTARRLPLSRSRLLSPDSDAERQTAHLPPFMLTTASRAHSSARWRRRPSGC